MEQGVSKIDIVMHLGAFTPKSFLESNNISKSLSNINNTIYLCENLPNTPKKFIFTSTLDVYSSVEGSITEGTPTIPQSLYGQSKLFCEKMLEQWSTENGVVLQILRVGHIYGRGEDSYKKIIPATIKAILAGQKPIVFSAGSELRSFLNVTDCCNLILKAIELEEYKQPINLVSEQPISVLALVNMIVEISKQNVEVEIIRQNNYTRDFIFDNTKMKANLGVETISLRTGLEEEYEYFKSKQN